MFDNKQVDLTGIILDSSMKQCTGSKFRFILKPQAQRQPLVRVRQKQEIFTGKGYGSV